MGDGLGGGRMGITIKQPLTAHTTPEQLPDELRWRGLGVWGCGVRWGGWRGALQLRSSRGQKRAPSAELIVL